MKKKEKQQKPKIIQAEKPAKKSHKKRNIIIAVAVLCVIALFVDEPDDSATSNVQPDGSAAAFASVPPEPEPEPEEQKFEQPEIEIPEEVLATVQVTQIAIVDADKVKNEVMDMETQKEDNTARGVVNQEGSDDVDKFKAVQEQVVVKEPEPEKPKEEEIFVAVEQPAEFPGGMPALMKWLGNNIHYPEAAQQNDIQGRVIVKFVVEKDGSIGQATILKGVDRDLDREALRVVNKMPKWQPGKNNGVSVRSYFTLPVVFRLAQQ